MKPAKIEHFHAFEHDGLLTDARAVISCGCSIYVGFREDHIDVMAQPCMIPHQRIVDRALRLLDEYERPMNEQEKLATAARLLAQASNELRPPRSHDQDDRDPATA